MGAAVPSFPHVFMTLRQPHLTQYPDVLDAEKQREGQW
jgi:hypothetical protein